MRSNGISQDAIKSYYQRLCIFARDTELPAGYWEQYPIGAVLTDPTFLAVSQKLGGFVAPHRFLLLAVNARDISMLDIDPGRAQCLLLPGSRFRVIDRFAQDGKSQIALLELTDELVPVLEETVFTAFEQALVQFARETFHRYAGAAPIPELDCDEWRERVRFPVGLRPPENWLNPHSPSEEILQ